MMKKKEISWEDFESIELRVGTIVAVDEFPKARKPANKLQISFGQELGVRQSSAQVTNYSAEELLGKSVVCVTNFPVKKIAGFASEVLVLGVDGIGGGISLLTVNEEVIEGSQVY